jgi:hypothetical protein
MIENWNSDLAEFNKLIGMATRQVVKEVILVEIKTLIAKIESMKVVNYNREESKANWTDIRQGSKIPVVIASQPKWVVSNRYRPLMSLNESVIERDL